jgi:DeoR/GlpR family transcriptional regulator of sugar metabolism
MPGTKIGADAFIKVCDADVFDVVVTDWECPKDHAKELHELGIDVMAAEEIK